KNRRRGIFPQPKVWKTGEYLVYFLFSKLRGWGKSPAIRPQTQLCGVALEYHNLSGYTRTGTTD
ncbi:MAG: hypothetical protein SPE19_08335, partial [Candidatus Faecousia sp.]|nr:hypothetical protein [Candidatus Faecousia sp.]